MRGGILRLCIPVLGLLALTTGPAMAGSPEYPAIEPPYPEAGPPTSVDSTATSAVAADDQPGSDLAKRVADLEAALKKVTDKEAEAKKKAASKPTATVFGRLQVDGATFSQNAASQTQVGNVRDGVEFRRARIGIQGDAFDVFNYRIEMDFANRDYGLPINTNAQSTAFKDVYVGISDLPLLGNVRIGHFKEPFGLDQLNSSNYITFMERSLGDEGCFVPGRNTGIMAFDCSENQRATWAIGGFISSDPDQPPTFQCDHGGYAVTMRGTFLPWYDEPSDGAGLIHTGIAYSYRSAPDNVVTFSARPEAHLGPSLVSLTLTNADHWQLLGAEAAMVYGPFSIQSEFFGSTVDRGAAGNATFTGCYAYVSYFLTGEHRPYKRSTGVFDRVKPLENFFRVRTGDGDVAMGKGAWEIAYRYSYIDVLDGLSTVGAGRVSDHTIGLNWYLNPYTRIMWNYVHSQCDRNVALVGLVKGGDMDIFEMRAQIDF